MSPTTLVQVARQAQVNNETRGMQVPEVTETTRDWVVRSKRERDGKVNEVARC